MSSSPAISSSRDGGVIVSQISPGGSRWTPLVWLSAIRIVGPTGASGRYARSGVSSSIRPAATCCMISTAVNVFVIEPIR